MKNLLFTALILAATPAAWATAPLTCREIPTQDAVHQKQECVFQGSSLNAAYQAFRQHDADNKAWLPKKLPSRSRVSKSQGSVCDDQGTRDLTIETIKVSKNALYLESDAQNFCSSPSKTILRMKKQGKQIRIQFDNYMS